MTFLIFLLILHFYLAEKNGKTLHLLKSSSKPSKAGKKRKEIPILGTYQQYTDSKKKPQPQANVADGAPTQSQINSGSSILQFMAPAPVTKENA